MKRLARASATLQTLLVVCLTTFVLAAPAVAAPEAAAPQVSSQRTAPDVLGCKVAPTPEMPGRGVVGFFESAPKELPPDEDPFAPGATTTIYEQYGYAGLRWNTYDLGCGPDLARSPDAAVGTAVANWMFNLPKTAVAATGAVVGAAFSPDFLAVFDPLIARVVNALRRAVFEQWFVLVLGSIGLLLIWKARKASLASSASAVAWALLVMVLVTMVFRWPLVAGHAADEAVTGTLASVSNGLNRDFSSGRAGGGDVATAGMQSSILYQAWLGGTFGDANSKVAKRYGPTILDSTALTWRESRIVQADPVQGKKIIEEKKSKFVEASAQIAAEDPDAYEYLTGRRSDSRVGYSLLAGLGALCAIPFLLMAGLLILGALVIVRFGVMLFPAFATLGMFPTMRSLVTGIGSTVASALINAIIFGIGAAVTVLGMSVLLSPAINAAAWLQIVLMLLLTIVMWVALSPFRRLTLMVSNRNHFAAAASGASTAGRGAARASGRILSGAIGTFLGVTAAQRGAEQQQQQDQPSPARVPQRAEASTFYTPIANDDLAGAASGPVFEGMAASSAQGASRPVRIDTPSVTVIGAPDRRVLRDREDFDPDEIYSPAARSRSESERGVVTAQLADTATGTTAGSRAETERPDVARPGTAWPGTSRVETTRAEGGWADELVMDDAGRTPGRAGHSSRAPAGRFESTSQQDRSQRDDSRRDDSRRDGSQRDQVADGVVIGRPARERTAQGRTEAETARDRYRDELGQAQPVELDELSEVFRPDNARQASPASPASPAGSQRT